MTAPDVVSTVGGGFLAGVLAGYALKKVIKIVAVIVGLFIAALAYLEYQRIFGLALRSQGPNHILLSSPPESAKTMFLLSLRQHLKNSCFVDGGNTTKAGIIDYLFNNRASYLLIDEIDKMSPGDQTFLL